MDVLTKLRTITDHPAPPTSFRYERINNLDILRVTDQCRVYTKMVEDIPQDEKVYHVIFVLYIDESHEYNQADLATYSKYAEDRLEDLAELATIQDVDEYFERHDALSADDLREMLDL